MDLNYINLKTYVNTSKLIYKNGNLYMIKNKPSFLEGNKNLIREPKITVKESALQGYFKKVKIEREGEDLKSLTLENFLYNFKSPILKSLNDNINYKVILSVCAKMGNGEKTTKYFFNSKPHILYNFENKNKILNQMIKEIIESYENKYFEGSGWALICFENIEVNYGKYKQFRGGCGNVVPPLWLVTKKCLINIKRDDNKCFYSCIMQHLKPSEKDRGRITKELKKIEEEEPNKFANFNGVKYPTTAEDIQKFQNQNLNIHLVIHGVAEKEERTPVIFDGFPKYYEGTKEKIHLVLYEEHYFLVSNLSRLLSSQINKHAHKIHFCYKCQRGYKSEENLNNHLKKCSDTVLLNLPEKGKNDIIKFQEKKLRTPSVSVYFDFESLLIPIEKDNEDNKINKHIPSAFAIAFISSNEKIYKSEFISYTMKKEGEDVAAVFVNTLIKKTKEILQEFKEHKKDSCFIPVFAHNLSGYDSHLCILQLAKYEGELKILPSSEERYISFSKYIDVGYKNLELRFLDSFKFLSSSLDKLVNATEKTEDNFKNTCKAFPGLPLDMLTKKGVYPYEWADHFNKLKAHQLPDINAFYSSLKKEGITEDEHQHALKAWDVFNCKTMDDYQKNYCLLDTVLLSDVMENFRKMNILNFKLDPFIYGYTLPGAAWHNMLKFTGQEIELITDQDIYNDFEKSIRGGFVVTVARYCEANNKYLSDYDPSKPIVYIFYNDKNNLYGQAMSEPLPFKIERKMTEEDIKNWRKFYCAIVCDLEINRDNLDYMKDYPPCPDHITINGVQKLVQTLKDKNEYMISGELLKFFISHNMVRLKKIHRGYIFKCSRWLKPYISFNTDKRAQTKDESGQNFYKLCNNAVYGKNIENPRKRSNVELVNKEERARKLLTSPEFIGFNILSDDLVAVSRKKTMVQANKPLFIGWYILEMSKLIMYQQFYDYFKPKFGDRVNLLYSDTDSFILKVKGGDLYEELKEDIKTCFDTSNYPKSHPMYSVENKNRLGFFKDETKGTPIIAYVSTCPKSYAIKTEDLKEKIKCKGVVGACINNKDITFKDYKNCIFYDEVKTVNYKGFKNEKHKVFTEELSKIALNPLYETRIVLDNKINTVPIGYFSEEEEARRRAELEEKRREIKKRIKEMVKD